LPDGSCSDGSDVAYVDPGGTDNAACTQAMPCTKVASALATMRPYVKLSGTTDEAVAVGSGRHVTFLADPGAVLTRSSGTGAIVTVSDDATSLTVYDLAISNAPNNASGIGVVIPSAAGSPSVALVRATVSSNPGGGISASGGTLSVTQSKIINNSGGGLLISSAQFTIVNNFIAGNGGSAPTNTVGGVDFSIVSSAGNQFDFNTVTANSGASNVNSGVNCGTVTVALPLRNNIIYGNLVSGAGAQLGGGGGECAATYSDIGPIAVAGSGNIDADPAFVNAGQGDYHITASSPCKDSADPAATLDIDIDGDTRPQGPARDIGADEYK
jgi:hypothetical protein